jgi:hypothetical protein
MGEHMGSKQFISEDTKKILLTGCFTIVGAIITGICGLFVINIPWSNTNVALTSTSSVMNPVSGVSTNVPSVISNTQFPPTETVSPVTVQSDGYEFFDDFEFGLSDQWKIQYGQLGMVDGKLTVTAPSKGTQTYHYIVLDDLYWSDMTIEVELAPFDGIHYGCDANGAGGIILHQGLSSQAAGFMYCARYEGVQLGTFIDDGEWSILPGSYVSGWPQNFSFHGSWHTIKIVSKGGTYVAYIDNKKITSATIPGSKIGAVGLWFRTHTSDSPELYSPRIESIKIVSNAP